MSERAEGSPDKLTSQKTFQSADKRWTRALGRLLFTKEHRQLRQFARLRDDVHRAMTLPLEERRRKNPTPTPDEAAVGVLYEEIEPQVRIAVFEFNRKGYKTLSSGFEGKHAECQVIDGNFLLNDETKMTLSALGVETTTQPWWKWQMHERMGITTPSAPLEDKILTTIRFRAQRPNLQEIEAKWKQIAATLPNKK